MKIFTLYVMEINSSNIYEIPCIDAKNVVLLASLLCKLIHII